REQVGPRDAGVRREHRLRTDRTDNRGLDVPQCDRRLRWLGSCNLRIEEGVQIELFESSGLNIFLQPLKLGVQLSLPLLLRCQRDPLDHSREASQDRLEFAHHVHEPSYPVCKTVLDLSLNGLLEEEVPDLDFGITLADAIDATYSLLDAHRVPGHVIV